MFWIFCKDRRHRYRTWADLICQESKHGCANIARYGKGHVRKDLKAQKILQNIWREGWKMNHRQHQRHLQDYLLNQHREQIGSSGNAARTEKPTGRMALARRLA